MQDGCDDREALPQDGRSVPDNASCDPSGLCAALIYLSGGRYQAFLHIFYAFLCNMCSELKIFHIFADGYF